MNFCGTYSKCPQIQTFKKIHPVGAELFRADRQTASHEEANSDFSQFCKHAEQNYMNKHINSQYANVCMYKNALMINAFLYSTVCQESNVGSDGTVQHKGTKTSE